MDRFLSFSLNRKFSLTDIITHISSLSIWSSSLSRASLIEFEGLSPDSCRFSSCNHLFWQCYHKTLSFYFGFFSSLKWFFPCERLETNLPHFHCNLTVSNYKWDFLEAFTLVVFPIQQFLDSKLWLDVFLLSSMCRSITFACKWPHCWIKKKKLIHTSTEWDYV